ncbi:MAG: V-type ATPase subunit, partial [Candidatus Bathyarchaeia archaeon]
FLESMIKEYGKTKSIVLAEILADKHLYLNILEIIQKLKGIDKKVLESITGTEIDLMNMNLIVRAKQLNLPENVIKDLILPIKYNLGEEIEKAIKALNHLESIDELIAGYYKKHLLEYSELVKKEKDVSIFEVGLKRFSAITNLSSFLGYPFHAGVIVGYLNLKMYEAQDIRAILLGKRDGLENERIKKSLIMYGLV